MKKYIFRVILILIVISNSFAQPFLPKDNPVFIDNVVARINIKINPDSLTQLYLEENWESDHEYPATFIFDNGVIKDTVENIGFRLRGNTSRRSQKKSFKVSFNTFEKGREFYDLEKMNLNGEHNDPSIIRSKLCWYLFEKMGVPASRANHVQVYINNEYYGLYINIEHIDENFVRSRFGNNDGNLYKCLYPADLTYKGSDPDLYKEEVYDRRIYDLKINEDLDDYSDLAEFISILNLSDTNEFARKIKEKFNVSSYMRALAVDVICSSWDDYWFWKNNYYLYHNTETDKFEFIPYDYDNSFGIWWDGIQQGIDWGYRNIYTWGNQNESRPLATKLLSVPEFRNLFSYSIETLIDNYFQPDSIFPIIDSHYSLIRPAAISDNYRTFDYGFTIQDFDNSYNQALGNHVTYGLKPYISTRTTSALNQLEEYNIWPIISRLTFMPHNPKIGDEFIVTTYIENEDEFLSVKLVYILNGGTQKRISMYDDGGHYDGIAGDQVYGASIESLDTSGKLEFYIVAADVAANQSLYPENAPDSTFSVQIGAVTPKLVINEFMASNSTTIADEFGEFNDWIELYNNDNVEIWLGDKFLTDNFNNTDKWALPDTTLQPGEFLLIWADDDSGQEKIHADFKLDKDGEEIGIFDSFANGNVVIDSITFSQQETDISFGRKPDGADNWQFFEMPTPGLPNVPTEIFVEQNQIPEKMYLGQNYPNPFNSHTIIPFSVPTNSRIKIEILNTIGESVRIIIDKQLSSGEHQVSWDGKNNAGQFISSGIYLVRMQLHNLLDNKTDYFYTKIAFIK